MNLTIDTDCIIVTIIEILYLNSNIMQIKKAYIYQ